jgi:hypothetical protein
VIVLANAQWFEAINNKKEKAMKLLLLVLNCNRKR